MTILVQKAQSNDISLSNVLDKSIYASRTYRIDFICDQTKVSQSLVITPTLNSNRCDFTIIEGTDITFTLVGFYNWELYEVNGGDNLLCEGKMKVIDTRTAPTTPSAISSETYIVADAGQ